MGHLLVIFRFSCSITSAGIMQAQVLLKAARQNWLGCGPIMYKTPSCGFSEGRFPVERDSGVWHEGELGDGMPKRFVTEQQRAIATAGD
jgi:hypothetical protein